MVRQQFIDFYKNFKPGDVMSLGQQLKRLRESKGFSQEDVAKKIGVTRQAVYKWEHDKSCPDIDNLILLSEMYNVTYMIKSEKNQLYFLGKSTTCN
ncbi:hypothetical protein bcere0028_16320 [Bacillus cereus AH1271]|nr:hypothetical protein bcere0028_16320 [Bacillus cereus AH1271]BCD28691.1 hypothetical protein BC30102_1727 [Bacillus cereus]